MKHEAHAGLLMLSPRLMGYILGRGSTCWLPESGT
jgi:hypothetical protein